ncbi:predicted protein [Nematostella vectensis]|uniref:3-oxo-5-alpha-steroid 4-dehydrogenase C-terminal domain-containing protein n=1 Tax=Nematostella vectensis TaxID=45351 RepID=A7RX92_NEMVE|nr:predicted protein [Nematostella vectensis]|eukprot:XP_001636054.1 predicted protein [Nematostella vectensis]
MKYSSPKTPVGDYYMDPRFILGAALFLLGFCINRYADIKLRMLRPDESSGYAVPKGGPFELVSCPNYFGEMLEWFGWALCTWSAAGLVWFLFGCGTFIPRAMHNHKWYKDRFPDYPQKRRALIPFLY